MSNDSNGSPEFDLELDVDDGMSASVLSSVDPTDLELDRLIETGRGGQQPSTQADAAKRDGRQPGVQPIYCDLETVPDESRMELFDIPAVQELPAERDPADCPPPEDLLKKSLDQIGDELLFLNPRHDYLNILARLEGEKPKPRAGVKSAINAVFKAREAATSGLLQQRKLLSVTPEYCQIVAAGFAVGDGEPFSLIVGEHEGKDEKAVLEFIWKMIGMHSPIVGFNCLSFDLQVIKARSILLNVEPSKVINDSPYSSNRDVCDLMLSRFGTRAQPMGLKKLAKLYGIPVPAGDVSGSDVEELWRTDPEKLGEYVRSDVWITRELRRKWSGYFCT